MHHIHQLWWLIHIVGISLWFGVSAGVLLVWPSQKRLMNPSSLKVDIQTLVTVVTRVSHTGAGLTALGGSALSLIVRPKSELAAFWLVTMQGLGVVAFVLSVIVLTRIGKRVVRAGAASMQQNHRDLTRYHRWLVIVFVLLLLSLLMAAFKPVL